MKWFRRNQPNREDQPNENEEESISFQDREVAVGIFYGGIQYSPQVTSDRKVAQPTPAPPAECTEDDQAELFPKQDALAGNFYAGVKCSPMIKERKAPSNAVSHNQEVGPVVSGAFYGGALCKAPDHASA